jgi:Protein of unknown function (DUF3187)
MPRSLLFICAVPLLLSPLVHAGDDPLYAKNLSPVAGLFGLPSARAAGTVAGGANLFAVHSSVASHYIEETEGAEILNLDGETLRLALEWRYGLADNWELQLEVPWLDHSGGQLDSLIDNWHDFWGMSDGGRSNGPRDVLSYRYSSPEASFLLEDDASGLGDISLSLNHAFYRDDDAVASVTLGYKFATGDEDEFLGSGGDDLFVALRFSGEHLADLPLSWHGQLGYLRAGDADVLADRQEQDLWFAGLGLDWQVAQRWSLLAQLDAHAAPADSEIAALGDEAVWLTVGARWRFAANWSADLSLIEDVRVETAPDVTFQASVRYRPGS